MSTDFGSNVIIGDTDMTAGHSGIVANRFHIESVSTTAAQFNTVINNTGITHNGLLVQAGNTSSETSFAVRKYNLTSDLFVVKGDGNVGIGVSDPDNKLHIYGTGEVVRVESSNTNSAINFKSTSGEWTFGYQMGYPYIENLHGIGQLGSTPQALYVNTGGYIGTTAPSSIRASKTNIGVIPINTDVVYGTEILSFNYRKRIEGGMNPDERGFTDEAEEFLSVGAIAEDVELLDPNFVFYGRDGKLLGIKYERYVPYLVKAIQELSAKVTTLENA